MSKKTWSLPQHLWAVSLLVVTYCVTARAALWFTSIGSDAALFWPPSGIALAALLLGGVRLAPAVLVAAVATNAWSGYSVWGLLAVSLGSTAEAVVAAFALQHTGFRYSLSRVRDVLLFIIFGVLLSPLLAALVGAGTLWAEGRLAGGTAAGTGLAWFLGDATGTLIVGPAVLLWYGGRPRWDRAFEALALLLGLVSAGFFALSYSASALPNLMLHICLAFLIWAAVRFGERGVAGTGIVLAIIGAWLIADSKSVAQTTSMHGGLILLQSYLGVGVAGALLLAATLSERRTREQELLKSQDMLAAAQRLAAMGNFEWNVATNEATWSDELYRIYGLQPNQFGASFEAFLERVHLADRSRVRDGIAQTLRSHESFRSEVRIVRVDGSERILATQANVVLGPGGRPERLVGICRDITEEKQAAEQLRASEERFRALTEKSQDIVTILDSDGAIRYQSGAIEALLGYRPQELLGRSAFDFVHRADLPEMLERWRPLIEGTVKSAGTVYRFRHKDGSWRTLESHGTNLLDLASVGGIVVNSRDVTQRILMEETLRETERRFTQLTESSDQVFWFTQLEPRRVLHVSPAFQKVWGRPVEDLYEDPDLWFSSIHPEDVAGVKESFDSWVRDPNGRPFDVEYRIVRPDREQRWIHDRGTFAPSSGPLPVVASGAAQDVTERRRAEERLKASEDRFRTFVEHATDGFFLHGANGDIVDVNSRACEMLGYSREELIQMHPRDFGPIVSDEDLQRFREQLQAGTTVRHESRHRRKDGSTFPVEVRSRPFMANGELFTLSLVSDITERKRAEEALNEARNRIVLAVRAGNVGLWDWNLLSNECSFSAEWKAQIGYDVQGIADRYEEWEVRVHPDDLDETLRSLRAALAPPWPPYAVEFRLQHKDGSYRWILAQGSLEFNAEGAPVRMRGSHVDVTERKQAELERQAAIAELGRSEERFSKLFYASPFSIMLATFPEGRIIAANPEFLRLFELGEDVIGKTTTEIHLWANSPDREIMLQRLRNDEPVRSMEFVFSTRSGEPRILLLSVELIELSGQKHALAMSIDITRRRQAEQALAESELRYRTLAETVPDSLSVSDPDGNITYASPSALRLFGNKSENELVGRNVFEWIPGAEHERAAADMRKILAGGTLLGEEYRLAKSDGSLFHGAVSATALRDPSGRPSGIVVLIRDISERKEAQEALRRSEERYHALAQAAHDIIFIARADGTLEYANDEAARRFRTTPKAIVGQRMTELLSSSGAQQEQSVRAVLETGDPLYRENLFHLPDGPAWLGIWLISLRDEEGRVTAVLAQARDITERKEKEQAVAAAKLRLELALEQSRISIWEADVRTGIVYLSREWQATLGAENAEETFTTLTELLKLVPLEDLPGMRTAIVNVLKGTHPRYSVEHRVRALDGSWKWIHSHGRVIERDARGRALRLAGTNTDISENKRVEAAVQESEAKFRTLVEQSLVGIYIIQDGRFVYVNQRCAEIHGRTVEEMLRLPSVFDVVTPPDRQAVRERIARCISGGVTSTNYAFSIQRKDGQVRELEVFGSRTDLEGRPAIIGTALDVTERRQRQLEIERLNTELEERVAMRTSQLEAANRELEAFSYSVSHDLRAPLRHISGFVKLLEGEAGPALAGRSLEYFEEVTNAALRMGKLIDNLLDFARIGKLELSKRPLSLEGIFKEVAGSLANECAGRKVVWRFGALPEVSADPTLLRQAIWNLLSNAVKYTRTCSEAVIEVGCFRDDHQSVTCYVRDNGAGFDAKYAHKLFGVFQRLHPTAQFEGTGIGLANVQRIVHRHGGKVWGEGKVNAGATFYFSLPKS